MTTIEWIVLCWSHIPAIKRDRRRFILDHTFIIIHCEWKRFAWTKHRTKSYGTPVHNCINISPLNTAEIHDDYCCRIRRIVNAPNRIRIRNVRAREFTHVQPKRRPLAHWWLEYAGALAVHVLVGSKHIAKSSIVVEISRGIATTECSKPLRPLSTANTIGSRPRRIHAGDLRRYQPNR